MSQSSSVPPSVNRFMKFILRSPFHGLVSKSILLITFTGRKSGKTYTTPVSYSQQGNRVIIFTHANWWKNLSNHAPVTLQLRGKAVQGYAETISKDKASIAAGLSRHLQIVRGDARYYGVTFDEQGLPRAEEIEKAASSAVMICIQLS